MRSRFLTIALLAPALASAAAEGSTLALIQSKTLEPYQQASQSFESALGVTVRRFDLGSERQDRVVEEIRQLDPSLVVAVGTDALEVAAGKLSDLPLVFLMVLEGKSYPARAAPVCGVTLQVPARAQIEALKALRPGLKTIGLLYDPAESAGAATRLEEAAAQGGVVLEAKPVSSPKEAMTAMPALFERCDAFIIVPDRTTASDACVELAVLLSLRHHVLLFSPSRKFVEKGALAAFATSYADVGAQAAAIARLLLDGKPAPETEPPRLLQLVVNGKIAEKLGVAVPKEYQGREVEVLS